MALTLLLALGLVLRVSYRLGVKAQSSLAVCDSPAADYSWMSNSKGQTPCLVAAYLQVPCLGPAHALIPRLESDSAYAAAPQQSTCDCNTVIYSLLEACQLCQAGGSQIVLPWEEYSANCTDVGLSLYPNPIPPGTAIPSWAFQDVTVKGAFDVAEAELTGDSPESTASLSASTTSTTSSSSSSIATMTSSDTPSSSTPSASSASASPTASAAAESGSGAPKSSNVGAIVGGVVGGVIGLILIGSAIFYMLRRQRNLDRKAQAQVLERPMSTVTDLDGPQPSLKPMSIMSVPSMIYDPDDPRTFPSATDPALFGTRAASPTPSIPPGPVAGHMHSFGSALQNYAAPVYNGSENGYGYAGSTYKMTPEV
ncbi:hypothetical protein L226DRAFT_571434 [Lentinus tigrinus ALCF2SS1-7]|uniref:Uncharacterized protein n=1 Tax=Lentinus tigrinus ALCF2SS1-6 TaxID=1328759 RepID=A0A5C2SFW3_9APHY|nr:hypothetical protein L227DRAFT_609919 [Lentinus tigrinus ALCF2SS1-6]RPD74558.1 hypothetical protein L226DRAFT_571434 [Lentinus tigrinus ALCF2SS1-7]